MDFKSSLCTTEAYSKKAITKICWVLRESMHWEDVSRGIKESLTSVRHSSSLKGRVFYHSSALGAKGEREEHLRSGNMFKCAEAWGSRASWETESMWFGLTWGCGAGSSSHTEHWMSPSYQKVQANSLAQFPKLSGLGWQLSLAKILTLPSLRSFPRHRPAPGLHSGTGSRSCIVSGSLPKRDVQITI